MALCQLSLTNFRNLTSSTIDFHPSLNYIYGENGSGKTSLLEAIYINNQAKSFRQHQLTKCIAHGRNQFLLFGRYDSYKAGLSRSDNKMEIRVNGETIRRQSELVKLTPIKIFNSDTFQLLTGAPEFRRQYIDWCLFHVEQSYLSDWMKFRHALKQRNKLLKERRDILLLDYWDEVLESPNEVICQLRQQYCKIVTELMKQELGELFDDLSITLHYQPGWDRSKPLSEQLKNGRQKDIRSGFTSYGIHRDNIIVLSRDRPVKDVLSRGQLKRLTLVFIITALKIVSNNSDNPTILLIDDLRSEIDENSEQIIYSALSDIHLQTFITNISDRMPVALKGKEYKMFHVEHGMIKPQKIS